MKTSSSIAHVTIGDANLKPTCRSVKVHMREWVTYIYSGEGALIADWVLSASISRAGAAASPARRAPVILGLFFKRVRSTYLINVLFPKQSSSSVAITLEPPSLERIEPAIHASDAAPDIIQTNTRPPQTHQTGNPETCPVQPAAPPTC